MRIVMLKSGDGTTKPKPILLLRVSLYLKPQESQWSLISQNRDLQRTQDPLSVSAEGYRNALAAAFHSIPAKPPLSLPWEDGVWGSLCGAGSSGEWLKQNAFTMYRPVQPYAAAASNETAPGPLESHVLVEQAQTKRLYLSVVSQSADVPWEEQRSIDFTRAVKLWLHTIMRWDSNCEVRQMLLEEATTEGQISLLEDFFRGRAPSTLMKRARSLAKIANWLQASDAQGFPISEKLFYEFLRDERSKGAPASRLKAYHEALVFSRFVLGVSGLERAISSRRCLGAAKSDFPRDRKQAVPLTVEQLKILHAKLQNQGEDVWNRLFAGAVLCVVYARSRWGDAQHACRWALDFDSSGAVAFLEISVNFSC